MITASKLKFIKESATIKITNKAEKLKKDGEKIITLSAGEPDFITPKKIRKAAIKAIKKGKTKYTAPDGIEDLKIAIKNKFFKDNNLEYDLDQIMVSTGAKQVLFNALISSLNKNDEILIPAPYWVSYTEIIKLCEAKSIIIKTKKENNFKIQPEEIQNHITNNTKWLILNSPSNPTGSVYTKKELKEISKILLENPNIYILSDEIYEHISFKYKKIFSLLEVEKKLKDRTLVVNGVSKAFAMTGWRIGYCAGPRNLIKSMKVVQTHSTSNPTTISQYASIEALNKGQKYIDKFKKKFKKRRNYICKLLKNIHGLEFKIPDGGFYIFVSISNFLDKKTLNNNIIKNDDDFCLALIEENNLALVPGSAFGYPNYVRISFAVNKKIIKEACESLSKFCESI